MREKKPVSPLKLLRCVLINRIEQLYSFKASAFSNKVVFANRYLISSEAAVSSVVAQLFKNVLVQLLYVIEPKPAFM